MKRGVIVEVGIDQLRIDIDPYVVEYDVYNIE